MHKGLLHTAYVQCLCIQHTFTIHCPNPICAIQFKFWADEKTSKRALDLYTSRYLCVSGCWMDCHTPSTTIMALFYLFIERSDAQLHIVHFKFFVSHFRFIFMLAHKSFVQPTINEALWNRICNTFPWHLNCAAWVNTLYSMRYPNNDNLEAVCVHLSHGPQTIEFFFWFFLLHEKSELAKSFRTAHMWR